jgi:hypothetical protein
MEDLAAWCRFYGLCCCLPSLLVILGSLGTVLLIRRSQRKGAAQQQRRSKPKPQRRPKPKVAPKDKKKKKKKNNHGPVIGTWWSINRHGELPDVAEGTWVHRSNWPDGWSVLCPNSKQGPLKPPRFGMRWDPKQGKWKN